jgi:hypothetical protein
LWKAGTFCFSLLAEEDGANTSEKQVREATTCCASGFPEGSAQLPSVWVTVDGSRAHALVDTGCSRTIVGRRLVRGSARIKRIREAVVMMDGSSVQCTRGAIVRVVVDGEVVEIDCLVVDTVPGYDVLLGMDTIRQLGGVQISADGGGVQFTKGKVVAAVSANVTIDDKDFVATFQDGHWSMRWKWIDGPPVLTNHVASYRVPVEVRKEFNREVNEWIRSG